MKRASWIVFFALFTSALAAGEPVDVLVVSTNDAALQPVLDRLSGARNETHAAWTLWLGEMSGKKIAVTRTEGDPLNAVAATALAIRLYPPKLVIVYGTARPHDSTLHAGDVVVSEAFAAFDGMVSPITGLDGGSKALQWEKLPHLLMTAGERETATEQFPADPRALALALKITNPRGRVTAGVLGSANQVNREPDRIAWVRARWHTSTEDGESAHVAGCATLLGVPIVGFRIVEGDAAEAAGFALRFLEKWP